MTLATHTLSRLSRLHGLTPTYSAQFNKNDAVRSSRGVTLWSTTNRHEADKLWAKTLGESHGKGHVTFLVTIPVAQADSHEKAGAKRDSWQAGAFPLVSGVPAQLPAATGDGPTVADVHPAAPARRARAGKGEVVHPQDVQEPAGVAGPVATTKIDLTKLVG